MNASGAPGLNRTLSLGHATLYGLGVTIGAGIYVLIGAAAAHSAMYAPAAFAVAALLMALTAASFAELVTRAPVAAGEAAYVALAFHSDRLATVVGLFVVGIAVISAATISVGAAGYIAVFVSLPAFVLVTGVVLAMGAIAAWGIKESVTFAGLMTLIEVGGLVVVILAGMLFLPGLFSRLPEMVPPLQTAGTVEAILSTTLLGVFAFIGFESLANVAEEVKEPSRTIPRAIFLTLIIATLLYMLVVWIALLAVPVPELIQASAPLALVFERLTGLSPAPSLSSPHSMASSFRSSSPRGFFTVSAGKGNSPRFLRMCTRKPARPLSRRLSRPRSFFSSPCFCRCTTSRT